MRPILEEPALPFRPPGRAVEQLAVVVAQAGERGKVMRADKHVDAVDLMQRQSLDGSPQMACVDERRARRPEALRGKCNPPRRAEAELFHGIPYFRHSLPPSRS